MFEEMIESYLAWLKDCKFDNNINIKSVILFGSLARGQAKEHSDIDLIVVASGLPELKRRDEAAALPIFGPHSGHLDALLVGKVLRDDGTAAASAGEPGAVAR